MELSFWSLSIADLPFSFLSAWFSSSYFRFSESIETIFSSDFDFSSVFRWELEVEERNQYFFYLAHSRNLGRTGWMDVIDTKIFLVKSKRIQPDYYSELIHALSSLQEVSQEWLRKICFPFLIDVLLWCVDIDLSFWISSVGFESWEESGTRDRSIWSWSHVFRFRHPGWQTCSWTRVEYHETQVFRKVGWFLGPQSI